MRSVYSSINSAYSSGGLGQQLKIFNKSANSAEFLSKDIYEFKHSDNFYFSRKIDRIIYGGEIYDSKNITKE